VLVSPQRTQRPWQGQVEIAAMEHREKYDRQCYLCPRNERAGGARNPDYDGTFVFDNDFAALRPDTQSGEIRAKDLLIAESEKGRCRVVCFSPRHDLTLARMDVADIKQVVETWATEFSTLSREPGIQSVEIFENRGAMMGCSNPHPHGQIWAEQTIPDELARELKSCSEYFSKHRATLLEDYLALELDKQERVVLSTDHFVVLVPFWAVWPFETLVISRRPVPCLTDLQEAERAGLAQILQQITIRYDNLFKTPFPYTMGFHQAAGHNAQAKGFHLHAHFYPPLLRSATVKKFMVGYEMLAMPQRDITPETAATLLKDLPSVHYLAGK
jgi:UDPglucose--hexose-1-phosphate uridylyltransferase